MRIRRIVFAVLSVALVATPSFATRTHRGAAVGTTHGHSRKLGATKTKGHAKSASHKLHGQQAIATERVTEIQRALIREHYLNSEANGEWDSTTQAAMLKFQQDNGWQTRLTPDSRALKKLGLGPDYSNAINARDASFAPPAPPASPAGIPAPQAAGFAAAAGVN